MPAPPSPWPGEPVRRSCRPWAAATLVVLFALTGRLAADDATPATADAAFVTVGPACPGLELDCADGRIATRWELDALARDLPSSRSVWSLLETVDPAAIVDRIDGAGLHLDEPGRFALRGASWRQNAVLLDGVDVTDPLPGGTPLLLPDVGSLQAIEVTSALAPADYSSPGATLALASREPAASWRGTVQASGLGSGLQSGGSGDVPSIARFGSLLDGSGLASGPIAGDRLRLLASLRLARLRRLERSDATELDARLVSGLVQLAWRAGEKDALRLGGIGQALERPLAARARFAGAAVTEQADTFGITSTWSHEGEGVAASAFAAFWTGAVEPRTAGLAAGATVERLRDGPVPDLVFATHSRRSSWSLGGRLTLRPAPLGGLRHAPRFGVVVRRASLVEDPGVDGPVPETVDGLAARVWDYAWLGPDSHRHALFLAAWASERITWRERLFVEAGLRLERTTGLAEGAAQGVSWTSLLPRVSARLRLTDAGRLTLLGGWAEYKHRLLLDTLGFGDPNAPRASVYRWTDANRDGRYDASERGPLVARVGPGDGAIAAIDAALRPPRTRELVAGVEASPGKGWVLAFVGFDRRESDLLESVDVGVSPSDYVVRYLPDPSGDVVDPQDDQLLPVFDRRPESFGLDRYLVTNPADHTGLHQGVELRVEKALGTRFALFAGATASRTEVRGGNRGFRVTENDQGVMGELFDDPNADTYALGRGFFDRAFTIKVAAAWRGPHGLRVGLVARYLDGQPFGRLVVVPDLAQGPEAIPATTRGQTLGRVVTSDPEGRPLTAEGHRFTYTLTVDARIEKVFPIGPRRLALVAEAFNLPGLGNEVEENPVWGPSFRDPTALQPPRGFRLGARFDF
ncbi:MAG TPA: Plug domain-containing protein [Vicinamibacteria bacterium]|nr:Plug domain-containing protein [Vicinamibacteria bacterium]